MRRIKLLIGSQFYFGSVTDWHNLNVRATQTSMEMGLIESLQLYYLYSAMRRFFDVISCQTSLIYESILIEINYVESF